MKRMKYFFLALTVFSILLSCAACSEGTAKREASISFGQTVSDVGRNEHTEPKLLTIQIPSELYTVCGSYLSRHYAEWGADSLTKTSSGSAELKIQADLKEQVLTAAKTQITEDIAALETEYDYIEDLQADEGFLNLTILSHKGSYRRNAELEKKIHLYAAAYRAVCELPQEEGETFTISVSAVDSETYEQLGESIYPQATPTPSPSPEAGLSAEEDIQESDAETAEDGEEIIE